MVLCVFFMIPGQENPQETIPNLLLRIVQYVWVPKSDLS